MDLFLGSSRTKRHSQSHHLHGPTLSLLVLLAALGAVLYAKFIYNPANAGDLLAYSLVLVAESIILLLALVALWTILAGGFDPRDFDYNSAKQHLLTSHSVKSNGQQYPLRVHRRDVSIDVFITVYGEPLDNIRRTATAARNIIGEHRTYILDDGNSHEVYQLARETGVQYIARKENKHAKAGNINHALALTSGEFFVVFDADFVPKPNFLIETVPFFAKPIIAFVQTPQHYGNLTNMVSRGAAYMQDVFYKLIQPGKNRFNAAFCVGTNVIFRRKAIESVGGIYYMSKSEDIWTSLLLHEAGYHSVFINEVLATGDAPETIGTYFKQQLRWATGGFEILLRHNFIKSSLTFDQKLQYISTAAYYLHGIAILLLMLLPPLHIFFNLSPVNISTSFSAWLFSYMAFYAMQILVAFYSMEAFRPQTIVLAMASFPIYLKALWNVILKRDISWQSTGDVAQQNDPLNFVRAQIMLLVFLSFTSGVGIWKFYFTGTFSLSLVWNLINNLIFAVFLGVVFKERRLMRTNKTRLWRITRKQRLITAEG